MTSRKFDLRNKQLSWRLHDIAVEMSQMESAQYFIQRMIEVIEPLYEEAKKLAMKYPFEEIIQENYRILLLTFFQLTVLAKKRGQR